MEEQPKLLKSKITLFPHQRQALAWLLWREHQEIYALVFCIRLLS